jgi:hypothetical protein
MIPAAVHAMFNGCGMTAEEGTNGLCVCVPDSMAPQPEWEVAQNGDILFHIDQGPDVELLLTFTKENGPLEVVANGLSLHPRHQRVGIATRFARNAYGVMKTIGVQRAFVHANYAGGGYSWAKLGAAPTNLDDVRQELLAQARSLLASHRLSQTVFREFTQLVMFNPDPRRLLLRVALSESPSATHELQTVDGMPLGPQILLPSSWHGQWDFTDIYHVAAIENALGL